VRYFREMCEVMAGVGEGTLGARGRKKSLGSLDQIQAVDRKVRSKDRPCHCHSFIDRRIQTEYRGVHQK
jgi:hypothetical protein